ncbi:MAG TPA: hypothetical protein PLG34_08705 [Spirochaetota bacterium]|jgi:hypothetical protein|nr:MAG: hypothetical protein BWX91_02128 [Spirochaetes bacterium ADurb.Bin133]HNZ26254.1 hypothetical protein [Spirochaetota bacterium]HPY88046.1 hypothetical protein [Spirochaetota bacterium]
MKLKKYVLFVFTIFLSLSCQKRYIIDVDAPKVIYQALLKTNDFFIQFNEPINKFEYFIGDSLFRYDINFPKANFLIAGNDLTINSGNKIGVSVCDTSGNCAKFDIEKPVINNNPAVLVFSQLQLKYSKKSPQNIVIRSENSGSTLGYKLVLYVKGKKYEIPFSDQYLKKGEALSISFEPKEIEFNGNVTLSKNKNVISFDKFRLSQSYSLIYITDNRNSIVDYFLYYNGKSNEKEYYLNNKTFKKLNSDLSSYGVAPCAFDIKDSSIKKKIVKTNGKYQIKKF